MNVKNTIRKVMWKVCGLQYLQNQLDTQRHFINNYIDITKFPKAQGNLALLHEADCQILKILHKFCEKNNLTYWLDYGTLLGAIRHQGFIPWDDDTDVSMPRADYEKCKKILPAEFAKFGIDAQWDQESMDRIGIGYKHEQTGIWIDIFPCEYVGANMVKGDSMNSSSDYLQEIRQLVEEFGIYTRKNYKKKNIEKILRRKKDLFGGTNEVGQDSEYMYIYPNVTHFWVAKKEDIFPLKLVPYDENEFFVPNHYKELLSQLYGNYMEFPKSGVLHHDMGRGALCDWHLKHGIDMKCIIEELRNICEKI